MVLFYVAYDICDDKIIACNHAYTDMPQYINLWWTEQKPNQTYLPKECSSSINLQKQWFAVGSQCDVHT